MNYIKRTKDGLELKDRLVTEAIAAAMVDYQNGAIVEACDTLTDVVNDLREFIKQEGET